MNLSLFDSNQSLLSPEQRWRVDQADAGEWLRRIPTGSVDLVCSDPAYESLEKHRKIGTTTRLTNDWFPIFPNARFAELFEQFYRVLKNNTHCYILCDQETMFHIKPIGETAGFKFWKPIVWEKGRVGMGYHYRAKCEFILFFEKGKRKLNNLGTTDVLNVDSDDAEVIGVKSIRGGYPTQKPEELLEVLISQSTAPSELVIDPFTGSGSCGKAALRIGRKFAGCDITERAANLARAGLEAL
jgi:site-specific DNA-methyltransferase (adenine-specific)